MYFQDYSNDGVVLTLFVLTTRSNMENCYNTRFPGKFEDFGLKVVIRVVLVSNENLC